jgi:hypothetical protein
MYPNIIYKYYMSQNNNTLPASSALTTLLTTISASVVIPTALVDSSIPTSTTLEIALVLPGSYVLAITKIIPLRVVAKLGASLPRWVAVEMAR